MAKYEALKDGDNMREETRRFYLQQKSIRGKCNYGSKSCASCEDKDECPIREYVE